ncbi:MAG: transcriptional regulator NrdR [Fusobacteriaceae bacterium]|jgi:transcriptional repressor NrdR|nr:transcriptional regulator NrdR [Fusobacteriaceae bacterium]
MKCPNCGAEDTKVIDSRAFMEGFSIKRRRECVACGKRFTTYEKVDEDNAVYVVKKDKRRDKFDSGKILRGLMTATVKRNISRETLELLVNDVEKTIQNSLRTEISTKEVGEMVLERLKKLDLVAYVRFASVYKEFNDVQSFVEVIEEAERNDKKIRRK